MGIKFCQESTQSLTIKFNVSGVEFNQFIEALKETSHKMGCNSHPTAGILAKADGNVTDLNISNNYGQIIACNITVNATTYVDADTRQRQNNDQIYHCLKNSLTTSGADKIISGITRYHI